MTSLDPTREIPFAELTALAPGLALGAAAPRTRITEVKSHRLRLVEEVGVPPGAPSVFVGRRGGGGFSEYLTDQGIVGIGPMLNPDALAAARALLVGKYVNDFAALLSGIHAPPPAGAGLTVMNAASLEIGLWDLFGKLVAQPLYKVWGGSNNRIIPYASFVTRGASPEERGEIVAQVRDEGWRAVKLRAHWDTPEQDARQAEIAIRAGGEGMVVMADANQAGAATPPGGTWDFARAEETAAAFQDLGVYWLEEPLRKDDYAGLAKLRDSFEMPIVGAEGCLQLEEFRRYLDHGAYDALQPEVMLIGVTRMLQLSVLAAPYGVDIIPHSGFGNMGTFAQLHFAAGTEVAYGEWHHDPPCFDYRHDMFIFENPPQVIDGHLTLSDAPGLGLSIKRDLIEATLD